MFLQNKNSTVQTRPKAWALTFVDSLLSISLVVLCCVVVLGSVLDGMTIVIRGDEIHNNTEAGSNHLLPAEAVAENQDLKNNNSENDSRLNYLYFDDDDDENGNTNYDAYNDDDAYDDDDVYIEDDDSGFVLLNRKKVQGADDLSEEDWTWTVFFDGLKQGYLLLDVITELYDCPSRDKGEARQVDMDDQACGASTDRSCDSPSEPAPSRIPTEAEPWKLFEEAYYAAVGMEAPPLPQSNPQEAAQPTKHPPRQQTFEAARGMKISYEVNYEPTNPTIAATTFVPKGAEVWTGSHTAGFTQDPSNNSSFFQIPSYHRFIGYLNDRFLEAKAEDNDAYNWACDAMTWTVSSGQVGGESKDNKYATPALCLSFDHGNLFESPSAENQETETLSSGKYNQKATVFGLQGVARGTPGVGKSSTTATAGNTMPGTTDVKLPGAHCQFESMIAARDIQPGEALYYDYGEEVPIEYDDDDDDYYDKYYDKYLDGRSSMFFNGK